MHRGARRGPRLDKAQADLSGSTAGRAGAADPGSGLPAGRASGPAAVADGLALRLPSGAPRDPSGPPGRAPTCRRRAGWVNTPRRPAQGMPYGHALNVAGTEWIIIVFAVLVLILGTNKLPDVAKKFGRAVNEYNRARDGVRDQVQSMAGGGGGSSGGSGGGPGTVRVAGPVGTEREKLEAICDSLGIGHVGRTDAELRRLVAERMGADSAGREPPAGSSSGSSSVATGGS